MKHSSRSDRVHFPSPLPWLAAFSLSWAVEMAAAPGPAGSPGGSRPAKVSMTASAAGDGPGAAAEVEVVLRDWAGKPVPVPRDVTVTIQARESSGVQQVPLVIKAGSSSARCRFPLHEGGIIELYATHPEMRADTAFLRLKPFVLSSSETAPGFISRPGPARAQPETHLGKEAGKVGGTARDIGNTAQDIHDAVRQLGSLFGSSKPDSGPGSFLAGSQGRTYLADNREAALIQIYLDRPVSKSTEIQLQASGGSLDPAAVTLQAGHDSGETRLTSERTGSVDVRFSRASPKLHAAPTNTLTFVFKPAIVRLDARASPPRITLLETADVVVQLQNGTGKPVATDERRPLSVSIVEGPGEIQKADLVIGPGEFEARVTVRPKRWGIIRVKASTESLPSEQAEVRVTLPVLLLSLTSSGGSLGGLLAAFAAGLPQAVKTGPWRRRLKGLPWWRMGVGAVTGVVLYWAVLFLSFATLPGAILLNPFSAAVFSLLGGWLGLNVFTLLLKRLHLIQPRDPSLPTTPGRTAKA